MKKVTLSVLTILFIFAGAAGAQDDMKVSAGVKAGWFWFQDEPISDFIEDNWIIGADVIVWFGNGFGIGGEVLYLDAESDAVSHGGFDVVTQFTQIPVSANAYFELPMDNDMMKVYIGGGVSYVFTDLSTETVNGAISFDSDDSAFGFNGLIAIQYGNFFAEGKYLWAEPELEHAAAGTQDMPTSGFSIMGGLRF
jgi:opacity protein-like surface antigen